MEIPFQNNHVVAVEKVAEQHIATKDCKCNTLRVISHICTKSSNSYSLDMLQVRVTALSSSVKVGSHHDVTHLHPQTVSLLSFHQVHLTIFKK